MHICPSFSTYIPACNGLHVLSLTTRSPVFAESIGGNRNYKSLRPETKFARSSRPIETSTRPSRGSMRTNNGRKLAPLTLVILLHTHTCTSGGLPT
jgi:hypothetical protein